MNNRKHIAIVRQPSAIELNQRRIRLKVVHNSVPPIPEELRPPCDKCTTSFCCRVFLVDLTRMEYESGLYGEYAVEITQEMARQLATFRSSKSALSMAADQSKDSKSSYFLEGTIGEPCPFLQNNKCSIYDQRPLTCRVYTCVGDERISDADRGM